MQELIYILKVLLSVGLVITMINYWVVLDFSTLDSSIWFILQMVNIIFISITVGMQIDRIVFPDHPNHEQLVVCYLILLLLNCSYANLIRFRPQIRPRIRTEVCRSLQSKNQ